MGVCLHGFVRVCVCVCVFGGRGHGRRGGEASGGEYSMLASVNWPSLKRWSGEVEVCVCVCPCVCVCVCTCMEKGR